MQDISPLPDDAGNELAIAPPVPLARPAADRKWTGAIVASCLLHAAAAAAFLVAPAGTFDTGDAIQAEGSQQSGADVVGTALKNLPPDAIDVALVADPQPAKPEAVQPAPSTEAAQPVKDPPAPKPAPEAAKQAIVAPDTLTAAIPNDQSVAPAAEKPTSSAVQPQSSEAPPADEPPVDLPDAKAPVPSPRPSPSESVDAGATDGEERDALAAASKGEKQGAAGNAMESGYSVEVQNKLARANRRVSKEIQEKALNNARVVFVVMADGSISDLQLAESSGSAELDQFALKLVRQQAPFPPIPPETGMSSWVFRARIGPF
ncbi:energy transducer TonB family protein [Mesorhizobium caraganae]|uniref:energy transducer TonB family protein n=1 Tax=Mesorhizobium caraganae TaxID=483206 RepID=UPI0033353202